MTDYDHDILVARLKGEQEFVFDTMEDLHLAIPALIRNNVLVFADLDHMVTGYISVLMHMGEDVQQIGFGEPDSGHYMRASGGWGWACAPQEYAAHELIQIWIGMAGLAVC